MLAPVLVLVLVLLWLWLWWWWWLDGDEVDEAESELEPEPVAEVAFDELPVAIVNDDGSSDAELAACAMREMAWLNGPSARRERPAIEPASPVAVAAMALWNVSESVAAPAVEVGTASVEDTVADDKAEEASTDDVGRADEDDDELW